jgi:flagellar basal-body rod protein FlgF/flagellar basal-body rod protein FlgG
MENAALIGLSRQMVLARELEVVANNIANLNTTGYKADGAVFETFMSPTARHGAFRGADGRMSYVTDRATWHDFGQGPLLQTGNPLDVALEGNIFLAVQTPRGERYTRNGSLQINATGQLVTSEGYVVQGDGGGAITFQNTDNKIEINAAGEIRVRQGSDPRSDAIRGKLRLVTFDQSGRLQKDGSSMFTAPGDMLPTTPQPPQRFRVIQGALEQSNVKPVLEMSRMVDITRTYQTIASLLQGHASMRQNAIDKLAEVPA